MKIDMAALPRTAMSQSRRRARETHPHPRDFDEDDKDGEDAADTADGAAPASLPSRMSLTRVRNIPLPTSLTILLMTPDTSMVNAAEGKDTARTERR